MQINLLLTFSIEKETEDELSYTRARSAKILSEIRKLETELAKEEQDLKTSEELKELKLLHETLKPENQELTKIIQQQRGE